MRGAVLRIGVVTDVHDAGTEGVSRALLDGVVEHLAAFRPDLVVDMGDRISDVGPEEDAARVSAVVERLRRPGIPTLFLHGNHDVVHLAKSELRRLTGSPSDHGSLHCADHHVVFLDTQDPVAPDGRGALSERQLDWLERDLSCCARPVVVFSHHPIDEQDLAPHWHFGARPAFALAEGRARARALLAASGRVRVAFAGHLHWNQASIVDGIPYVTVSSLIEKRLSGGVPAGSFALVTIEAAHVTVDVRGLVPMSVRFP